MSRQNVSIDICARRVVAAIALCACCLVLGCARVEEYQLGQAIEMGPYTFEVSRASEGRWSSTKTIDILFRLHRDDTKPFTTSFRDSFMFQMELVDAAGNAFPVDPSPIAPISRGGRLRSDRYRAEVRLSPSHEGVRDAEKIGTSAGDFTLMISNPSPEANQPRRVAVRLQ
jgi:hypothetical protein